MTDTRLLNARQQNKAWRENHPKENAAKQRRYINGYRGIYRRLKSSAIQHNRELSLSFEQFIVWRNQQPLVCHYCGKLLTAHGKQSDSLTIDRVDNNGGYTEDNITLCCYGCNSGKGNRERQPSPTH